MIIRKLTPGSEWLYFKIYTGIKTADIILEEVIPSVLSYFQENNLILKWFFIRYSDPKPHLRIRFLLINSKEYNNILNYMHNVLDTYVESGEIYSIQLDTYKRELERYGYKTIEDAESLFRMNSELTLDYLHLDDEEKIMVILFYIDQLLSQIGLSITKKLQWITDFNASFKEEFNADKNLNQQLDKKYRLFYPKFLDFLKSSETKEFRDLILENLHLSTDALKNICNSYDENSNPKVLQLFFQSIFHMAINRLFISQQRLFEMIIYDYLHRYYKKLYYLQEKVLA
ncbi:TPA: thiopeptide-type bacteriocin biosynthesis protein [Elizabethkingia anophelis]|uniref:thiopeptide-type bacteriocin biosynthesis protein n=1 Tax=Elizabethkingia TaxID=308865 RepID=UPI000668EDA0|nr:MULTISPECIES: thiopeptide-type bacteriocin biosynthesis protein [Elizabethkingia]AQW90784.1 lantibiotic dehydratase [Elizabethkingia anophelis]KUY16849.1 lantibiotic dehydratase [Elizabethkingia anophelis]MCT3675355.1 lantibiotic dehydratase [Elizabethkingia anophelis]MCT3682793.1 lantibiotic dehydratase [Elizabethkingia anophelis]MCT3701574.1 lantibiotic dehydratase [Elizabethkingia anophelis]